MNILNNKYYFNFTELTYINIVLQILKITWRANTYTFLLYIDIFLNFLLYKPCSEHKKNYLTWCSLSEVMCIHKLRRLIFIYTFYMSTNRKCTSGIKSCSQTNMILCCIASVLCKRFDGVVVKYIHMLICNNRGTRITDLSQNVSII